MCVDTLGISMTLKFSSLTLVDIDFNTDLTVPDVAFIADAFSDVVSLLAVCILITYQTLGNTLVTLFTYKTSVDKLEGESFFAHTHVVTIRVTASLIRWALHQTLSTFINVFAMEAVC